MRKFKSWLQSKTAKASLTLSALAVGLCGVVSAAEGDTATGGDAVVSAFQTGFQSMANDALQMIAIIVPIALGVAGVIWLARKALSWFKSMAK